MSSRTYRATFTVTTEITIPDEAVTRVNENGWRDTFYKLDERGVVEMISRCCAINGSRLFQLDGWADMREQLEINSSAFTGEGRIVECEMDDYALVATATPDGEKEK